MPTSTGLVSLESKAGVGMTLQLAPSQWMASVFKLPALPTAHTSLDATVATPNRVLSSVLSLGLGTMFQVEPFQCNVSVRSSPGLDLPTAHTSVDTTASTAKRMSSLTFGLGRMLQAAPFQCIVSERLLKLVSVEYPTAQMSFAETTETAVNTLELPATLGLATTLHVAPFQCSTSVL